MKVIVGIDPSAKRLAGVITVDDGEPLRWVRTLGEQNYEHRCARAHRAGARLAEKLRKRYPMADIYVFIEQPAVGRGGPYPTIIQSKVHGALVAGLLANGYSITIREVNISHWKKIVVKKGNAGKPEIKAWARMYWRQLYDLADGDQDVIDAGALNRYGYKVMKIATRSDVQRSTAKTIRRRTA